MCWVTRFLISELGFYYDKIFCILDPILVDKSTLIETRQIVATVALSRRLVLMTQLGSAAGDVLSMPWQRGFSYTGLIKARSRTR